MSSFLSASLCPFPRKRLLSCLSLLLCSLPAVATVTITSPALNSTSISAVRITASATNEGSSFNHLEIWDQAGANGAYKLGNVFATTVNGVFVLPNGPHTLIVNAVSSQGVVLDGSSLTYSISETCSNSSTLQCNFDQLGIANPQWNCSPPQEALWVGNPCAAQGQGSSEPASISIQTITESGTIPDYNNLTLNGKSLHLSETQASAGYSNVIFKADTPTEATTNDTHWTLDEYVYLPNPNAHQAFEIDTQFVWGGVWTKFYTECAFNISSGTGFWAVFGGSNGWKYLDNTGGAPRVPCDRSQFYPPWSGAGSSFTGWHHIVWTFTRNSDGSVAYDSLTFDATTTNLNGYIPTHETGGSAGNNGDFGALVQLDGAQNASQYPTVDVYVNELNITHTP